MAGAETVKIAFIDPLSGLMAPVRQNQLKSLAVRGRGGQSEELGRRAQVRWWGLIRAVSPQKLDHPQAGREQEASAISCRATAPRWGWRSKTRVAKHNERNPGKNVYLNYAVDPDMTKQQVQLLALPAGRQSPHMKMEALTTFWQGPQNVKKVYLINQNYSPGHQVTRARQGLPEAQATRTLDRGEDLHPLAQVRISRRTSGQDQARRAPIRSSPATGAATWPLLIKASADAGLTPNSTPTTPDTGVATAMGARRGRPQKYVGWLQPNNKDMGGRTSSRASRQEVQRRFLRDGVLHGHRHAERGDEEGQLHRSGEGGPGASRASRWKACNGTVEMRNTDHQSSSSRSWWPRVDQGETARKSATTPRTPATGWKTNAQLDQLVPP